MPERLEKAAAIERESDPMDRRGTMISIDQPGDGKVASGFDSIRMALDLLVADDTEKELKLLAGLLKRSVEVRDQERTRLHLQAK